MENVTHSLDIEKIELFAKEHSREEKDRRFELVLRLMDALERSRNDYSKHRTTHLSLH
jgi:hypothetical protein